MWIKIFRDSRAEILEAEVNKHLQENLMQPETTRIAMAVEPGEPGYNGQITILITDERR